MMKVPLENMADPPSAMPPGFSDILLRASAVLPNMLFRCPSNMLFRHPSSPFLATVLSVALCMDLRLPAEPRLETEPRLRPLPRSGSGAEREPSKTKPPSSPDASERQFGVVDPTPPLSPPGSPSSCRSAKSSPALPSSIGDGCRGPGGSIPRRELLRKRPRSAQACPRHSDAGAPAAAASAARGVASAQGWHRPPPATMLP
mmetsp:Transcript_2463/g.7258  ORF Transcript_2463/g.7258 Transcript_2463/m.7258 type:complete len:202 (+) Transcript_2463:1939-2544(+)